MSDAETVRTPKELGIVRRKPFNLSQQELVKLEPLYPDKTLPLVATPTVKGVDLIAWAKAHQELVQSSLRRHGAILFRNFAMRTALDFEEFIRVNSSQLLEYRERSSPRSNVSGHIYTSTDHPADQSIFLHNENSYQQTWPMKISFFCVTAAQQGGETPIADCRRVFRCIPQDIKDTFIEKKVMYVRNFGDGFGLSWQIVFQTNEHSEVERQCQKSGLQAEWKEGNRLRTRAVRPVIALHPLTREITWFNHATFFNVSTLEPRTRAALLAEFSEGDLPTNTFYGDGSPIEPDVLDELRECYRRETVAFPWQERDILMLDNMLAAHGRAPFSGLRRLLTGMADPFSDRGI